MAEEKIVRVTFRMPPDLHRRVEQTAEDDRRSLNAEIQVLLEEALRARDQQQKESPSSPA